MNYDPSTDLIDEESTHLFLCFCTFVMNLKGKKLSIQNVFIQVLSNDKLKSVMKDLLNLDTDYELVRVFLDFDPTIAKSKYVTKYLNSKKSDNRTGKTNLQQPSGSIKKRGSLQDT
jgi:hypothetical protein